MSKARTQSDAVLVKWAATLTGDVLSIGSANDRDGAGRTYRSYFAKAATYTTSECVPTPGCDLVLDVRAMPEIPDARYDCLFVSGVLEHVDDCHAAVRECFRILKPGGVCLVGVPFQQRIHRAPQDYWRFTAYGVAYLLRAFEIVSVVPIGDDPKFPWTYWVYGRKPVPA